jgi:polyisoprenyl-phosphate glycosyltransferase
MSKNSVSLVIPVYNESTVLDELYKRVVNALSSVSDLEIVFVDDGSTDDTLNKIKEKSKTDQRIRFVSFSRNFGHQVAVSAGIDYASKDAVVVMDADLQDPPEVIPKFIDLWQKGSDVVYAVREHRKESLFFRACYFLFYRVLQKISDIQIPPDSGDFCLMDKRVVQILKKMPERNRYVRGIRAWVGFNQTPLAYERDHRHAGKPKYNLRLLMRLGIDGITSFSLFPLRLCGYLGYTMAFFSLCGLMYPLISKFFVQTTPQGWTSLIMVFFFIGGVQLVMLSLVGSYIGRIYTEVRGRPLYIIRESGNFE